MIKAKVLVVVFSIIAFSIFLYGQDDQKSDMYKLMKEAIENNNPNTAIELINKGIDLNYIPNSEPPYLASCIGNNNIQIAELLLNNGISADAEFIFPDGTAMSPLIVAIFSFTHGMFEEMDIIELLIRHGANINYALNTKENITSDGLTPLLLVSGNQEFEDLDLIEYLIENGADVNQQSTLGFTALMMAIIEENNDIVNFLLEKNANVNAQVLPFKDIEPLLSDSANWMEKWSLSLSGGSSVLHLAVDGAEIEIIELLLNNDAIIDVKNDQGLTPLHKAASDGYKYLSRIDPLSEEAKDNYQVVELLLNYGANINQVDNLGETALHKAATYGNSNIVSFLLERGADPAIKSNNSKTASEIASDNFQTHVSEILDNWDKGN